MPNGSHYDPLLKQFVTKGGRAGKEVTKICSDCGKEKDIDEFGVNKATKDGHSIYCKECLVKYSKRYQYSGLIHPGKVFSTKIAVSDIVFLRNMELLVQAYKQMKHRSKVLHNFRFAFKTK